MIIDEILLNLVMQLKKELIANNLTISVAESCTGGLVASSLTSIEGASKYFSYGFITYSNQAKIDLLNIQPQIISQFGAVSKETAEAMAVGALYKANSSIAIAITGIAGPSGGTTRKPIGTVWIALSKKAEKDIITMSFLNSFDPTNNKIESLDNRQIIRYLSCKKALELLLQNILR